MVAKIKLDQVGLFPPGEEDQSRSDGLADGSRMSAYSVDEHTTYKWEMLWAPLDDIEVVVEDSTERGCYWDPTAYAYGEYRLQLTVDEGEPTQNVSDHTFGVRTPKRNLLYPALNQDADPNASLVNTGAAQIRASSTNEPFGPFTAGSYAGWLMHYYELVAIVEDLTDGGAPTRLNKDMPAKNTAGDGDLACDIAIAITPIEDSYVYVHINGQAVSVGDSSKTSSDCYLSGDGGSTARAIADVETGDTLHWNGSVAGYQLTTDDRIDFDYDTGVASSGGGSSFGFTISAFNFFSRRNRWVLLSSNSTTQPESYSSYYKGRYAPG